MPKIYRAREWFLRRLTFFRFGDHIKYRDVKESITEMLLRAKAFELPVATIFNDIYFVVTPEMDYTEALAAWETAYKKDYERYAKSFRAGLYKKQMQARQLEQQRRREEIQTKHRGREITIRKGKVRAYRAMVKLNSSDGYSRAVVTYVRDWALAMEDAMASGERLENVAENLSHYVDYDGITGFQHGVAVSILAEYWKHGERLRKWHNLQFQIGTEGIEANKTGGVLNPALLAISAK